MSWAEQEARAVHRGHVFTLIDLARALRAGVERVPQSQEALRAKSAASVLERALEEVEEGLR